MLSPQCATAEQSQTLLPRGSKSRNKVSVGEPAEGSMPTIIYRAGRRPGLWV